MQINEYLPVEHINQYKEKEMKYDILCPDGKGSMICIDLLDGIQVIYNDFHCLSLPDNGFEHKNNCIIEINHCLKGRFESRLNNMFGYIKEGDMAICDWRIDRKPSEFPLGYYYGVEILIDVKKALHEPLLVQFGIDLNVLIEKIEKSDLIYIMRATSQVEHIFMEMYDLPQNIKIEYLKVKVIELLLFLKELDFESAKSERHYYKKSQIEIVKKIRNQMMESWSKKYDVALLAKQHNISASILRKCFKEIYGKPIYQWHKEYRLEKAKELLLTSDLSIIEIAALSGYENPSKFSAAFNDLFNQSPSHYRLLHK